MGLWLCLIEKFKKIFYNIYRKLRKDKNMRGDLFLGYARHMTELDAIANRIWEAYCKGESEFVKEVFDDLTQYDVDYIQKRLESFGLYVTIDC